MAVKTGRSRCGRFQRREARGHRGAVTRAHRVAIDFHGQTIGDVLALWSHVFEIFGLEVARSDRIENTVTYMKGKDCLVQSPGYVDSEWKEGRMTKEGHKKKSNIRKQNTMQPEQAKGTNESPDAPKEKECCGIGREKETRKGTNEQK